MSVVEHSACGCKVSDRNQLYWLDVSLFSFDLELFVVQKVNRSVAGSMHKTLTLSTFVVEKGNIFLGLDEYTTMDFISVTF